MADGKKIYLHCSYILCGAVFLNFVSWWALDSGINLFLLVIINFLLVIAVLAVIIIKMVPTLNKENKFPTRRCFSIASVFAATMAFASFICQVIISMARGSNFADDISTIGILVSIILAFSFIVCLLTFYFTFAFRNAKI